jgi:glycosyltransferase involved in cell wall biosynthesis
VRITFLCPHLRIAGGVRAILMHADRLAARGHDVRVVVPVKRRWRRRLEVGAPEWMPELRAHVVAVPDWSAAHLPDGDALIATAWQSADPVAAAPARCGRKVYFIQHYESLYHGDPATVDATYRLPLAQVVISTWLAELMRTRFGTSPEVIVTPVDGAQFHFVPEARDDVLRVLMLHHDYPWKGVAEGLDAVGRARAAGAALVLVGFGMKPPTSPAAYDEYWTNPPQSRLAWLYSRCAIYLCPSWDEGLGMPPMEAMACGAALCTFDTGGSRDYAVDGETALVVPRRDVPALGAALARLTEDSALRARVARQGQAFIATRFDWPRATARLEAVLAASR